MELGVAVLGYGTFVIQLLLFAALGVFVAGKLGYHSSRIERLKKLVSDYYKELAFLQALVATSGSLYLSNFLGWEPCRMCWFQRILIYPIVAITAVGILFEKEDVSDYVIPLALIGIPISGYHYLVQRYDQFHSAGCSVLSVSCETKYTFVLGYISIPMMALTALVAILVLMWRFSSE